MRQLVQCDECGKSWYLSDWQDTCPACDRRDKLKWIEARRRVTIGNMVFAYCLTTWNEYERVQQKAAMENGARELRRLSEEETKTAQDQREGGQPLTSSELLALPEEVKSFIKRVTLHLQASRSKTPAQMDEMFQEAYKLYCKYQVESGSANRSA